MTQEDYDLYRILKFIADKGPMKKTELTRQGLSRFKKYDMAGLYAEVKKLEVRCFLKCDLQTIPRRRGPAPYVYSVTTSGSHWLREMNKEIKQMLKKNGG